MLLAFKWRPSKYSIFNKQQTPVTQYTVDSVSRNTDKGISVKEYKVNSPSLYKYTNACK